MPEIVLATSNPHKVDELRAIFAVAGLADTVRLMGLADVAAGGSFREPEETGSTFEENARIKALSYAAQTGLLCLADDSGLEIDALSGRPGVISSHYATDGRETGLSRAQRDAANNERVLKELEGVPLDKRGARFVCVMVLAGEDGSTALAMTRGTFEGRIGVPGSAAAGGVPRGSNGFGYDPLFLVGPDFARTSAELSAEEKNRLSHRAMAAMKMAQSLRTISLNA